MTRNVIRAVALLVMGVFTVATYATLNNLFAIPVIFGLGVVTVCWWADERDARRHEAFVREARRYEDAA